jgi:RND family efflux transporter MFP subunit
MTTMNKISTEDRPQEAAQQAARNANRIPWSAVMVYVAAVAAGAGTLAYAIHGGVTTRVAAESSLARNTEEAAVPIVNVIHPKEAAPLEELVLPGNTQAFSDTPIFARTSGYLKRWVFDIGAHVKRGDLLAEIETPEIDKQLQQTRAELATAQANHHLAETTAARWQFLLQSDSVSVQETDEKIADLSARKATVDSNASNVRRLEDLQSFQKVYAPFDGVLTARNTDVGALIDAGANSAGKELFHLAAIDTLRVFVAIPEVYSRAARPGAIASLTLDEFPGRSFQGTLARTSNSIDQASHTLLTEVDVRNPDGQLLPGAYVSVHFKLPGTIRSVVVPSNTLLFRSEGLRVALVRDGRVQLASVKIGRDYGSTVEIISGLQASDAVVLDPADSLISGGPVRIASHAAAAPEGSGTGGSKK